MINLCIEKGGEHQKFEQNRNDYGKSSFDSHNFAFDRFLSFFLQMTGLIQIEFVEDDHSLDEIDENNNRLRFISFV